MTGLASNRSARRQPRAAGRPRNTWFSTVQAPREQHLYAVNSQSPEEAFLFAASLRRATEPRAAPRRAFCESAAATARRRDLRLRLPRQARATFQANLHGRP